MRELNPSVYEHPSDRIALATLKKVPLLDKLGKALINFYTKTDYIVKYKGNAIEVTENTTPRVHRLKKLAEERLCLNMEVPMFITLEWGYNAFAAGVDHPIIVLNSGLVENFSDDELLSIIGHEMGHIKSKHMLYHWMANNMSRWMFNNGVISGVALLALLVALNEWQRKSELTADRAGVIASNNRDASISGMMKLMGVPEKHETSPDWNFTLEGIIDQVEEHESIKTDSLYQKFLYAVITNKFDHPWTTERIKEIKNWKMNIHYSE